MKNLLLICLLLPILAFSQGVRREVLVRVPVSGSYAANVVLGSVFSFTDTKGKKGVVGYISSTTDTVNAANSVRVHMFSDTAGFGTITPGAAFTMSDTMAASWRGSFVFSYGGVLGNGISEVLPWVPYNIIANKKIYFLAVSETACKFKYLTGKVRFSFAFNDN